MIEFANVTKRYGKFTALDSFSLRVSTGEAVALWGPNGAGKTTAMKCMLDLLRYKGQITVDGLDAHKQGRVVRRRIGYVPQQIALYPQMGALETIEFFARLNKTSLPKASESLEQVGLAEHASKAAGTLSGGMKQRLALGIALLGDPSVLVLDEPTTNLDSEAREQFLSLLTAVRRNGKTILFTSHRLEEVQRLADRVLVMEKGRLLYETSAHELAEKSGLHTVIKLYIAESEAQEALSVLATKGFDAQRNGVGILVKVRQGQKALPIQALSKVEIDVADFEIE